MSEYQTRQDRHDEDCFEQERLEREAKKAAAAAERARIKAHGLVKTKQVKHRWLFGKHITIHKCPVCHRKAGVMAYNAVCTGVRIRKERRDADGRSIDIPSMK